MILIISPIQFHENDIVGISTKIVDFTYFSLYHLKITKMLTTKNKFKMGN